MRASKVSEISEATAASAVSPEERVNFHIGNPVQDPRLKDLYLRLVLDDDEGADSPNRDFLKRAYEASIAYLPRGGFPRNAPSEAIKRFRRWLVEDQRESLDYDLGVESGAREVCVCTGGAAETVRVALKTVADFLVADSVEVLTHRFRAPRALLAFKGVTLSEAPDDDLGLLAAVRARVKIPNAAPTFLVAGGEMSEDTRRTLRRLAVKYPLYVIEANGAPNHLSLAREASMERRVLRIVEPSAIRPKLAGLTTTFVAGETRFIRRLESVHFRLKGTPAAAEVELFVEAMDRIEEREKERRRETPSPEYESAPNDRVVERAARTASRVSSAAERVIERAFEESEGLARASETVSRTFGSRALAKRGLAATDDPFACLGAEEVTEGLLTRFGDPEFREEMERAAVAAFAARHPQYDPRDCFVVGGSSRTALGLLGFSCGVEEAAHPDLSWTYADVFPRAFSAPLADDLELDPDALIDLVRERLERDSSWRERGAVVFNNPHNASGKRFDAEPMKDALTRLLRMGVRVIDDLAYWDVAPDDSLAGAKTVKRLALELVEAGKIGEDDLALVSTAHTLSKTDSFAGGRLCVVEIPDKKLRARFDEVRRAIAPNLAATALAYLFYRNPDEKTRAFWLLRNAILKERMDAMQAAAASVPEERNPFDLRIARPEGALYPRLVVERLPDGVSLDWLASGLAAQGIGMAPLATFARTAHGFELARKTFRLTLGGPDDAETFGWKTRRVFIFMNRMIAQENRKYNKKAFERRRAPAAANRFAERDAAWESARDAVLDSAYDAFRRAQNEIRLPSGDDYRKEYLDRYLPERLEFLDERYRDRRRTAAALLSEARADRGAKVVERLEYELYKDDLGSREERFRTRLYDRTVHPTQAYSLSVERLLDGMIRDSLADGSHDVEKSKALADELAREYFGLNVAISSAEEANEALVDLDALIDVEDEARFSFGEHFRAFLSYWGDWDGSSRPSGQGHYLVAGALTENVSRLASLLRAPEVAEAVYRRAPELREEIAELPRNTAEFWTLMNEITRLTNQLEKRFRTSLPLSAPIPGWRRALRFVGVGGDPTLRLYEHNDRLERRMREMRGKRRASLERIFRLNKTLRKAIRAELGVARETFGDTTSALAFAGYRDLLKRFVLTPRIHQNLIVAKDPFAIDTTAHNIVEINEIAGAYGNPGMALALQISMSTEPEALVALDRKMRARREHALRETPDAEIPVVRSIPLFEDLEAVRSIESYLDRVWDYAVQSRGLAQEPSDRFAEIVGEIFVAGSDLSQQTSQTAGAALYREVKSKSLEWLARRGLVGSVRMKLGSGEPMQRQGGYVSKQAGAPLVADLDIAERRLAEKTGEATRRGLRYAKSPMTGALEGGDLRTFQSFISEHLRRMTLADRADFLLQVREKQRQYEDELRRAAEPFLETRLKFSDLGLRELERVSGGLSDELFDSFVEIVTKNFRRILYGAKEDVVGLHAITYFISRATPTLRDRPTVRPSAEDPANRSRKALRKIAETLPLAEHGSMLRAIGHNRSQSAILGYNQLTTGLFRAIDEFTKTLPGHIDPETALGSRVLPRLPVYEALHTFRLYHEPSTRYVRAMERKFPAGNSAFVAFREDVDCFHKYVGLFQQELLRRHGVNPSEFFEDDRCVLELLPALRPDVATLLQPDLLNVDFERFAERLTGRERSGWLEEARRLVEAPARVREEREKMWRILRAPIETQVESFVKISRALYRLSEERAASDGETIAAPQLTKLSRQVAQSIGGSSDDSMREFLVAATQYFAALPAETERVPLEVFRALKDVEQIAKIEGQPLAPDEQAAFRFHLLKTARLCGENG
jgi:aspartate/methionine/tyrosine aminotransferase